MKVPKRQAERILKRIEYYESKKNNNIFDYFYTTDLDVFRDLIKENTEEEED